MKRRLFAKVGAGIVLLAALLGTAEARAWSAGAAAVGESDAALVRGDARMAIAYARTAAEAAVPFSPYPREGYARLESIARNAEKKGDLDVAGFAWRAMRSAATATRPASAAIGRVAEADDGILSVARRSLASGVALRGADESVLRDELATDETPSPWAAFLVTFGALALAAGLAARARGIRARAGTRAAA